MSPKLKFGRISRCALKFQPMLLPVPSFHLPVPPDEWQERLLAMHGAVDSESFIQAVFRLVEGTVKCDFSMVVLHAVDALPMVARDSEGREFSYAFMEQSYRHNPATPFLMANPGVRLLTTREQLPAGDAIYEHPFYEHGMKPMGFRHCLALFFWDYTPAIAHQVFAIFRAEGREDYSAQEEAAMLSLHPHIDTALKRIRRQQGTQTTLLNPVSDAALSLDWEFKLTHCTPGAGELLRTWSDGKSLPESLVAACRQLKEMWRDLLKIDPLGKIVKSERIPHPGDEQQYADVRMIFPADTALTHPSFSIELKSAPTTREGASQHLARLTPAEREVAALVANCLDNQQIADRLSISVAAVKTRLHTAFKKLQIVHRSQLVALLKTGAQ